MSKIRLLDDDTINKIAAGEVVERPASIVKELIENAVDAGATLITVEIEQGGVGLIRVRDNGHGMEPADMQRALLRHATSKIRGIEDVQEAKSLGFRGEALPSIAAVSRLEVVSRPHSFEAGFRLSAEGGRVLEEGEIGAAVGTCVTVRDLFFNTPARRKFLKSVGRESTLALGEVLNAAFSQPQIRFRATTNGKEAFLTPGGGLFDAIVAVYGVEFSKQLLAVESEHQGMRIEGLVGGPALSRSSRKDQFFSVNSRSVRDGGIRWALEQAYGGSLPSRRYPVAFLGLLVPPSEIDVNVHPAKTEVRFRNDRSIRSFVLDAVAKAVSGAVVLGGGGYAASKPFARGAAGAQIADVSSRWKSASEPSFYGPMPSLLESVREHAPADGVDIGSFEPIGRVLGTYIVADNGIAIALVDQHAAHERINYETIRKAFGERRPLVQPLLAPKTIQLGPVERAVMREHRKSLTDMGFEIEDFGKDSVLVRSNVSVGGVQVDFGAVLENLCLERPIAKDEQWPGQWLATSLAACVASIKANQYLDNRGQQTLLKALAQCEQPLQCPHGRPTIILYPREEIERRFGRR